MSISKEKTALFFSLSISITVFSALFTFMPSFLLILGAIGMILFLSIQLYQKEQRVALDYARLLLILVFSGNYAFMLFHLPYVGLFTLITKLALIAFLILYVKKIVSSFQDSFGSDALLFSSFGRDDLSYVLADLATVYIVIASLFKILNWEIGIFNCNLLLIIGLFAALTSFLTSPKGLSR